MTESVWTPVANALLGSWPSQVASWGREALVAYIEEIEARGITPDEALVAIRSCPAGQRFPPSAPELAGLAHRDPDVPTGEEMLALLYEPGGVFWPKRSAGPVSPWVLAFVESYGRERLRMLEVDHETLGGLKRRELREAYARFLEANEGRAIAEIAKGRRQEGLRRPDLRAALGREPVAELPESVTSTLEVE